jgi:hypothetical protein
MAEQMVEISLVQGQRYRQNKKDEYTVYGPGRHTVPLSVAKGMGVMHRIRRTDPETGAVKVDPFVGTFDDKLTGILNKAGYNTLGDLRKAAQRENFQSEMLALEGIGPAAYERIVNALQEGGE